MPLPNVAETAADRLAGIGRTIDDLVTAHIIDGDALPTVRQFRADVLRWVRQAVTAAMQDIDPQVGQEAIDAAVDDVADELADGYRVARDDAIGRRRRILRVKPVEPEPREQSRITGAGFVSIARRTSFAVAVATMLEHTRSRERPNRERLQQAARVGKQPMPARMEGWMRAQARTGVARVRNFHACDVVDSKGAGWALYIRDALQGSDEPCVRVDRKWATSEWLRRHPVEHPNCTRIGRPRQLGPGDRITLLR